MGVSIRVRTQRALLVIVVLVGVTAASLAPQRAEAAGPVVPSGFTDSVAISGLSSPSALAFAPDGKVFVAERTGVIKVFDNLSDTTPTVFADLSLEVYNQYDRGLLGLTVDPQWPTRPYIYVMYAYDGDIGGS